MSISLPLSWSRDGDKSSERLQIHHLLFLLFIALKPFYLRSSGTFQISDVVFVLSFIAWLFNKRGRVTLTNGNEYFSLFILCVFVINIVYTLIYPESITSTRASDNLLVNILYYLYNFLVVIQFSDYTRHDPFLKSLLRISIVNIIFQAVVYMLGIGRYLADIRYQGTFNDPNQLSFFLFMSFLIVFILSSYFEDKSRKQSSFLVFGLFLIVFFLVSQAGSTGILLGIVAFSVSMIIAFLHSERGPAFFALRIIFALVMGIVIIVLILGFSNISTSQNYMMQRVFEKINKAVVGGIKVLIEERGLDKVYKFPQYLFFGSGEGNYLRFATSAFEIHSTIPSILFTYGILPFLLLFKWVRMNLKHVYYVIIPAYIGLLFESLTLLNQRQPMFWMLILLGSLAYQHKDETRKFRITRRI